MTAVVSDVPTATRAVKTMPEQVHPIMRTDFLSLEPDMPIRQAAGLLLSSSHDGAPVLDETGCLVGILTQKDCFRPALQASYYQTWQGTVADQMTRAVTAIDADAELTAAAEKFLTESYRAFPVLRSGRVVGWLRREDVLRRMVELG